MIWLMVVKMQLNFAPLFQEPQLKSARSLMLDPFLKTPTRGDQEYLTECQTASFFLALKASTSVKDKSTHPEPRFLVSVPTFPLEQTSSATTVGYQGISPNIVPTQPKFNADNHLQQQHQTLTDPISNNQVEYNFDEYCEHYEFKNSDKVVTVKDRLKNSLNFWKSVIKPSDFILNVISCGYRLEFLEIPDQIFLKNNKSALEHAQFAEKAILELVSKNLVTEMQKPPHCVNPLSVSAPHDKKPRLILDLRHVNSYIVKRKVKFEGVIEGLNFAKIGNYMVKYDLTSGYHHINIHPDFFTYLGFSWKFNNVTKFFVFTVLPFGLCSSGYIFTKTLRPLVTYWRSQGIKIVLYLDDGWICDDLIACQNISLRVQSDLENAGFLVNQGKSQWEPVQILDWLGFTWNLRDGFIDIPGHKIENLHLKIDSINKKATASARELASFVG